MRKTILILVSMSLLTLSTAATEAEASLKKMQKESKEIISKMTVSEKISQLMNDASGIERLGIKPYNWWGEALHGVGRNGRATIFPQPIAMASTFDEALIKKVGTAISTEARAKFRIAQKMNNYAIYTGLTFWSPNVNIFRDPRWGRGLETWGEDPYLTGCMASAFVKGMQGDDPVYLRAASCAKHYAVHSGPESTRHKANITPSSHDLYETYLPAFKMLVKEAKVEAVMGAYNAVYGESCSGSKLLLTDILRNDWGFEGHVVSDCGAINDIYQGHQIAKTPAEAAAISLKAGMNVECGNVFKALPEALKQGLITEKDLDKALMPLMMTRLKLGILHEDNNCPYNNIDESVICSKEHAAISRQAATECMVLLKNEAGTLPLDKNVQSIYILGPAATDVFYQMGNYYGVTDHFSTYLQGITAKVSNGTSINYKQGFNAYYPNENPIDWSTGEGASSKVTILFMGINGNFEGEEGESLSSKYYGDRNDIKLPECQMTYFRKIAEKHQNQKGRNKLITIVCGGSPLDLKEITEASDAVVMAWYSGQEGGDALGDLLFGDANFSGRLPLTFPESVEFLPAFDEYNMKGRTYKYQADHILFPFGYGLTYGKVSYNDLRVSLKDKKVLVEATISNGGEKECDEIAQLYLSTPTAGVTSPYSSLIAFKRINLKAGEKKTISFTLTQDRLNTVQEDGSQKLLKGQYKLTLGGAAPSGRTEELGISSANATFQL